MKKLAVVSRAGDWAVDCLVPISGKKKPFINSPLCPSLLPSSHPLISSFLYQHSFVLSLLRLIPVPIYIYSSTLCHPRYYFPYILPIYYSPYIIRGIDG